MNFPTHFFSDVIVLLIFGLIAIGLLVLAFKIWDFMTPQIDEQKEISNNNLSLSLVISAYMLSVAWIIVTVVKHVLGG